MTDHNNPINLDKEPQQDGFDDVNEQPQTVQDDDELSLDKFATDSQTQSQIISDSLNTKQTQQYLEMAHAFADTRSKQTTLLIAGNVIFAGLFALTLAVWSGYPKTKIVPVVNAEPICEVTPSNNPALTDQAVSNFAQMAVLHTNSFSFADHEEKIEWAMSNFYTTDGRLKAVTAIKNLGLLQTVDNNLFTLKANINGTPSVANIEDDGNNKVWTVKIPMQVSVFGATKTPVEVQNVVATATVVAHNATRVNPTGLAIDDVRYLRQ